MADEEALDTEGEGGKKAGGKLKMIILIVVGVLLIVGLSIGGTWFMLKDRLASGEPTDINNLPMGSPEMSVEQGPAIYHAMQPAFVINYNVGGRNRFLQVELTVLTRDAAAVELLILHNPLIRNNLLEVFSVQDVNVLGTSEGKQKLVDDLTKAIQDIMEEEAGRPGIETVLFRSFVIQ